MPGSIKVLIIAEEANPEWVSVPLVGWSISKALGEICQTHIVTQVRNKEAFETAGLKSGVDFTALDTENIAKPMWKVSNLLRGGSGKGWTTVRAIKAVTYYFFEILLWKKFGSQIKRGDFQVVHRVTPLGPTVPSILARKCHKAGIPFVIGPLNGGVPWPKEFLNARKAEKEWLSYVRDAYKLLPGYRSTIKYSAAIICGSQYTLSRFPEKYQNKCFYIPENAIDPEKFTVISEAKPEKPLRTCFIGRLVPYKGPDMLLEAALPHLKSGAMTLDILGDGPLFSGLEKTINSNGLQKAVTLHGWVEHSKVKEIIANCNLLAFPSIREFGGGVVLEAMATGLVPLIVDYAGPSELVAENTGFKVPLGQREDIILSFSKILAEIAEKPEMLLEMRLKGIERVNELYTWEAKARQILKVYSWVLDPRLMKPDPLGVM